MYLTWRVALAPAAMLEGGLVMLRHWWPGFSALTASAEMRTWKSESVFGSEMLSVTATRRVARLAAHRATYCCCMK